MSAASFCSASLPGGIERLRSATSTTVPDRIGSTTPRPQSARSSSAEAAHRRPNISHDGNGHSHVRAALVGPSLTVPFVEGRLTLGTWQQITYLDFDVRPRRREIIAQIMGE